MQRERWLVSDVLHSGRKKERGLQVTDRKYEGLIGYHVTFDMDSLAPGKEVFMTVTDSPDYEWWRTSIIVAYTIDVDDPQKYLLETANSIYVLEKE